MCGLVLVIVYVSVVPLIFITGPFIGILMWYWIALMNNPEQEIWYSIFVAVPYSFVVAVATLLSWLLSQRELKFATEAYGAR
jgi:Family of unknown function (DUF5935)